MGKRASAVYGEVPYLDIYAEVVSTGQPRQFETQAPSQGKYYAISVVSPAPEQFATIFSNITERREAERRLAESERQYRQFFESNTSIKWLIDPSDGRIIEANQVAADFYGYTKASYNFV